MSKHSFTHYYIQSKKEGEMPKIVGHSQDKKTKEIYYKFLDKKKANKLLEDEREVSPEYQYRIVKETITYEESNWQ
jgi:hypothetical protein